MTDTSYNIPQAKAVRVVAAQQRDGEQMDGKIVPQSPQPGSRCAMPIGGGGLTSTVRRLRALRTHAPGRRSARRHARAEVRNRHTDGAERRSVTSRYRR